MDSTTIRPMLHVAVADEAPPDDLLLIDEGQEEAPLSVRLLAAGWKRGLPPQLSVATWRVDAKTYRKVRCPECGGKMLAEPFYLPGTGRWKIVLACCPGAETEA